MKTITTEVYTFKELTDDKARAAALQWAGEALGDDEWWLNVYRDAEDVGAKISGFDCERGNYIKFRLEWDAISTALAIRKNHGESTETYKAAVDFISKHDEFHGVNGKITLLDRELSELRDGQETARNDTAAALDDLTTEWEEIEADFTRTLGECYLSMLKADYEYTQGEEYLSEFLTANEYTFTAQGKRFG